MLTKNKAFTPAVISCKGSAQIGFTGLLNQKRFGPAQKFWTGPKLFWTFKSSGEAVKFIEKTPTSRLIECSHVSGKQWAIIFFGLASSFPNSLNTIDEIKYQFCNE